MDFGGQIPKDRGSLGNRTMPMKLVKFDEGE